MPPRTHAQRFVLVVGMHRSGTSAVAGMLGALGLQLPLAVDRMSARRDNPSHFESISLTKDNIELLAQLGGSWSAPPELREGWHRLPACQGRMSRSRAIAQRAFPSTGPAVWKDPQTCLLLPYWRAVLGEPLAAMLVWRSPAAVATSLQARDKFSMSHGFALWHHYNAAALEGLDGIDMFGACYDDLITDPASFAETSARWLDDLGVAAPPGGRDVEAARKAISADYRHIETLDSGCAGDEESLGEVLRSSLGPQSPWHCPKLPDPPQWQSDLLAERRAHEAAQAYAEKVESLMRNSLATSAKFRSKHVLEASSAALRRLRGRFRSHWST